ncbi:Low temperature requirement A protein [Gracilaria domingensis]|nr:Low temperature requirement A protein [Gracilaria domingensis]
MKPSDSSSLPEHSTPSGSGGRTSSSRASHHHAHHVEEFGEVENIYHHEVESHHSDAAPPPLRERDRKETRNLKNKAFRTLFDKRHLQQYFYAETLYRSPHTRTVRPDELFFDLVLVGGIAALGHELRENFSSWKDVEKFFLLFSAIYSSWRVIIMMWNFWDIKNDLFEKISIYAVFFCLIGIALGAHGAFQDGIRPYVAICSFLATAIPSAVSYYWASKEPLLRNPHNRFNQLKAVSAVGIISVLPYFAAAFVGSERATRILYWIPLVAQFFSVHLTGSLYRALHRNRPATRLAVNIELMVEKYEVLTMIVLGESVIGILFEAGKFVTSEGARLGRLYAVAAATAAMLYSLQTLYINVDSPILKGGQHAIRHNAYYGIAWSQLHTLYHMALILFATGLGISIHDVVLPPKSDAVARWLVRAGEEGAKSAAFTFERKQRWLFSVGWGMSMIISAVFSALHKGGPRAASKSYRIAARVTAVLAIMIGLPFTDLRADLYLGVHTAVLVFFGITEFILVHFDRLGFFRSEGSSKATSLAGESLETFDSDDEVSRNAPMNPEDVKLDHSSDLPEEISRALKERMCKGHSCPMVQVQPKTRKKPEGKEGGGNV